MGSRATVSRPTPECVPSCVQVVSRPGCDSTRWAGGRRDGISARRDRVRIGRSSYNRRTHRQCAGGSRMKQRRSGRRYKGKWSREETSRGRELARNYERPRRAIEDATASATVPVCPWDRRVLV